MTLRITPINDTAAENGEWTVYRGVQLKIARANNTKFKNSFRRHSKPLKYEIDKGTLSEDDSRELLASSMSEAILVDWNNFIGEDGESIQYSIELAKELLLNDADCLEFVQDFSGNLDNYINQEKEKLTGK